MSKESKKLELLNKKAKQEIRKQQKDQLESNKIDKIFLAVKQKCIEQNLDFSKVNKLNLKKRYTRFLVSCQKHGNIEVTSESFSDKITSKICKRCKEEDVKAKNRKKSVDVLKLIYKDYDFSKVDFYSEDGKVKVICKKHGEFEAFCYKRNKNKQICPFCLEEEQSIVLINKIKSVNENYEIKEINFNLKVVTLFCNKHGIFKQFFSKIFSGHGCTECFKEFKNKRSESIPLKISGYELLSKFKKMYNNCYTYQIEDNNFYFKNQKIKIYCKTHGEFIQYIGKHLTGFECQLCSKIAGGHYSTENFIKRAKKIHGDKYDYSKTECKKSHDDITIICKKHGEFKQKAYNHINGCDCLKCSTKESSKESEIIEFIKLNCNFNIITKDRSNIFEIDILIKDLNLAFEINGVFWHTEVYVPSNFHLNKTNVCKQKDIDLIHIYEDDWLYKKEIVKSRILSLIRSTKFLNLNNFVIKNIDTQQNLLFLNENSLENYKSDINLGLFVDEKIISVINFEKNNLKNEYIITNYCSILNCVYKDWYKYLFQYFIKTYNPENVLFYIDRSWFRFYEEIINDLNFKFLHDLLPTYKYVVNNIRVDESEYIKKHNETKRRYSKIYDSGISVYSLK
jgi:hypothetical protein